MWRPVLDGEHLRRPEVGIVSVNNRQADQPIHQPAQRILPRSTWIPLGVSRNRTQHTSTRIGLKDLVARLFNAWYLPPDKGPGTTVHGPVDQPVGALQLQGYFHPTTLRIHVLFASADQAGAS